MFKKIKSILLLIPFACFSSYGQDTRKAASENQSPALDTIKKKIAVSVESKEEKNRNIMLNAANNTGPRDVNIGLPSTLGGITIQENNLPVVYFYWPELPNRTWRQSTSLGRTGLLKIGEAAITLGDLGFAVNSYTRLGSDKFAVAGNLSASNFGWLKGDLNVSGPLSKGWSYTLGAFSNFDPSTYDLKFARYADRTQIYRAGITRRFSNGRGEISAIYKYANSASLTNYAVFQYKEGGKAEEIEGFRIGRDSYIVNDGTLRFKDIRKGTFSDKNLGGSDAATLSHNFDIIGNYSLNDKWKFYFDTRLHYAEATQLSAVPLSISNAPASAGYTYASTGLPYTGNVNSMVALNTPGTPTTTMMGRFEIKKSGERHNLRIGILEQYYRVNEFTSSRSFYYQTVSANPDKLLRNTPGGSSNTDQYGFYNYNVGGEYHNGFENKLSAYLSDDWNPAPWLTVNYGLNLRYHKVKGDYYQTPRTPGFVFDPSQKTYFDNNFYHVGGSVNTIFKVTKKAGVLADFTYTEKNVQLENYSSFASPNLTKTRSPLMGLGLYYNHEKLSIVSQATYLTRNNNFSRLNLVNPQDGSQSQVATVFYDIQTIGWTTDVVASPFKGFSLHYLLTFQDPIYKNYNFSAFGNNYSYDNKNVLEISKVLMEIDPSYTYNKFKVWASFRYFSQQYANLTNALYFQPRWETFGGLNYKLNSNIDLGLTAVNFLNQRGAKGTISGAELITDPSPYYDRLMVGSYIRPFTLELSLNFKF